MAENEHLSGFERGTVIGADDRYLIMLIYKDFHVQSSEGWTESFQQKKKKTINGNSVVGNPFC